MNILPNLDYRITATAIAVCLSAQSGMAATPPGEIRTIVDTAIKPLMSTFDVPGMAVAVTVDGKAYFYNYGVASRADNTPVSQATLFELGSVSKTLTATLGTYAQALGKLSLEAHPGKYMPQLKGHPVDKASLLQLGTYTPGGLPLQFPDTVSDSTMVEYFQKWTPAAAPGQQRQYSNASIGLFGHIASLALQRDFADVMEKQIFPELGLKNSYINVPSSAMANYAWGYNKTNQPVRVSPGVFAAQAYGVKSNSADMIRFVEANIAPAQLDTTMRRAVEGTQIGYFNINNTMVQGLGWEQYTYPVTLTQLMAGNATDMAMQANPAKRITPAAPAAMTWYNKTGSTNGFGNYIAFVPGKKIGIVMLANKNYPIDARIKAAHAVLEQLAQ